MDFSRVYPALFPPRWKGASSIEAHPLLEADPRSPYIGVAHHRHWRQRLITRDELFSMAMGWEELLRASIENLTAEPAVWESEHFVDGHAVVLRHRQDGLRPGACRVLDKGFIRAAGELFRSELVTCSIPTADVIYAADGGPLNNQVHTAMKRWSQSRFEGGGEQALSPALYVFRDGELCGFID
jgi:hypothetical protein